jgi:Tfp pilus assembly protein FimT
MGRMRLTAGITLIEIMVVVGIVGAIAAFSTASLGEWFENQRIKTAARSAADAFLLARSEAIRTGRNHIVFFSDPGDNDPGGTPLVGPAGWAPILILNDGLAATANCQIDGGEAIRAIAPVEDVTWGVAKATTRVPDDPGGATFTPPQSTGSTFADPSDNAVRWVMFRSDGIPVPFAFSGGTCGAIGVTGSGGGALYVTNGHRDYAVVLSALGGVRVHAWGEAGWSN